MADLTEAAAASHLAWRRGQGGERLVVVDRRYSKQSFQVWDLEEVRLERCRFTDVDLRYAALSRAELLPQVARHFSSLPPPDEASCLVAFAAAARRAAGREGGGEKVAAK